MHRLMGFFFLCVIGVSCTSDSIYFKNPNLTPEEEKRLNQCLSVQKLIFTNFTDRMRHQYELEAIGLGGLGDQTNHFHLTFNCYEKMDLMQARKLLIDCVQEFVKEINAHEDLSPCVSSWPFTYVNTSIVVLFLEKNQAGQFIQDPYIASARLEKGRCSYKTEKQGQLLIIKEETFEDALAALNEE